MLVQFTLKNFLSFKESATLDMTAINAYKEHQYNLIDLGLKEKFLKVAAIYGANASGKSNFYLGFQCFQKIIMESFNNVENNRMTAIEKYYMPYSFQKELGNTEFEIIFVLDDYEYKYGYEYNEICIVNEWMYRKNLRTNRVVTIFERDQKQVILGASVRKECDVYKEQIPNETLVLSFFNKLKFKNDIFSDAYNTIMST